MAKKTTKRTLKVPNNGGAADVIARRQPSDRQLEKLVRKVGEGPKAPPRTTSLGFGKP